MSWLWIIIAVIVLVVLLAAAFVLGRAHGASDDG